MRDKDFCIFILSHGRPNNVATYRSLTRKGCTYPIYFIVDDEDDKIDEYYTNFGKENVIIINKREIAKTFDTADNFDNRKCIVYARNACFDIAKDLGYTYFLELDDDYTNIYYRIDHLYEHPKNGEGYTIRKDIDKSIEAMLDYYKSIDVLSIAMSQGGDWFAGKSNFGKSKRKCMNTFFCSTNRPFKFVGNINEDVNTYIWYQSMGNVFFTIPFLQIVQLPTQSNSGGMTDLYLDSGTYVKSFYTVLYSPSSVHIALMGSRHKRLHHHISWKNAVPCIIRENLRFQNG